MGPVPALPTPNHEHTIVDAAAGGQQQSGWPPIPGNASGHNEASMDGRGGRPRPSRSTTRRADASEGGRVTRGKQQSSTPDAHRRHRAILPAQLRKPTQFEQDFQRMLAESRVKRGQADTSTDTFQQAVAVLTGTQPAQPIIESQPATPTHCT